MFLIFIEVQLTGTQRQYLKKQVVYGISFYRQIGHFPFDVCF